MTKSYLLLLTLVSALSAQTINSLDQTLTIQKDGSAKVRFDIQFSTMDSIATLQIPAGYTDTEVEAVKLNGNHVGIKVEKIIDRSSPVFQIQFDPAIMGDHVVVLDGIISSFLDWEEAGPEEFKTYNWESYYTNTLPGPIESCGLTVILPEGWNYHRITGSDPKFKKKEPKPPYTFKMIDGKATASITRAPMEYMESVGIEYAFKKSEKPSILIYIGLLVGLLYMYFFRHLILNKDIKKSNDSDESKKEK